jgi:hypothetical protein
MKRLTIRLTFLLLLVTILIPWHTVHAANTYDVFLRRTESGTTLYFVDLRTGLGNAIPANGTGHTLIASGVLYVDSGVVRLAMPDGRSMPYEPIAAFVPPNATVRIITSPDRSLIAWSATEVLNGSVSSDIHILRPDGVSDGAGDQIVLVTSSMQGIESYPVAVTNDGGTVFYMRRAMDEGNPFPPSMYSLNVSTGEATLLWDSAGVLGFSPDGRYMVRLNAESGGTTVRIRSLESGFENVIDPLGTSAESVGVPLISRSSTLIAYVQDDSLIIATPRDRVQRILISDLPSGAQPVAFTSELNGLLLVGDGGTYKVSLTDGSLLKVSDFVYMGQL